MKPYIAGIAFAAALAIGCSLLTDLSHLATDAGQDTCILQCNGACTNPQSDRSNCGTCGHTCMGDCTAGACQPLILATGQGQPVGIATDGTSVFWANNETNQIMKCAVAGCNDAPTVIGVGWRPYEIAIDQANVFFTSDDLDGGVYACAQDGCPSGPTTIATRQPAPTAIAVDGTNVYWGNANFQTDAGGILKCNKGGCANTPSVLVAKLGAYQALAIDQANVYFNDGFLSKCSIAGCDGGVRLATVQTNNSYGLAIAAGNAYWTSTQDGTVKKCSTSGCGDAAVDLAVAQSPYFLTVDTDHVYWTNNSAGTVMKCAQSGCGLAPTVLASGQASPFGIAVDQTSVYWTNSQNGTVVKIEK